MKSSHACTFLAKKTRVSVSTTFPMSDQKEYHLQKKYYHDMMYDLTSYTKKSLFSSKKGKESRLTDLGLFEPVIVVGSVRCIREHQCM